MDTRRSSSATTDGGGLCPIAGKVLRRMLLLFGVVSSLLVVNVAAAQEWPARPIKMIIGWSPGGPTDTIGRILAEHMSKNLGKPIVVENRPGASGQIGALAVARAAPDGYTLLYAAGSEIAIAPAVVKTMQYNSEKDLQPVSQVSNGAYILATRPSFPASTLADFIAYAKDHPGKVTGGTAGIGANNHLTGEQFNLAAGINTLQVPYKGSGPALFDVMAGQVDYIFESLAVTKSQIAAGKLKPIAVAALQRFPELANVPTMAEAGLPGFVSGSWTGLLVPVNTPKPIVDRLHAEVVAALKSPQVRKAFDDLAIVFVGNTPEEFGLFVQAEITRFRALATKINLKLD